MPHPSPLTEQDVIAHADLVYATCLRLTGNAQDAADISQDVFMAWMRQTGSITGSVAAWLHVTARQRSLDWLRRQHRKKRHEAGYSRQPTGTSPEQDGTGMQGHLDASLAELDAQSRTLLLEHHLGGCNQETLAARFGMSQATVSRRLQQALQRLRGALERRGVDAASLGSAPMALAALKDSSCPLHLTAPLLAQARVAGAASLLGPPVLAATGLAASTAMGMALAALGLLLALGGAIWWLRPPPPPPPLPPVPAAAALAEEPPPPAPPLRAWAVDEALRRELATLVETAIRYGFPDARGAGLWYGSCERYRIKPRTQGIRFRELGQNDGSWSSGLHGRLADGTWLLTMASVLQPETGSYTDTSSLLEVPSDRLVEFCEEHADFVPRRLLPVDHYLRAFDPAYHDRIAAAYRGLRLLASLPDQFNMNTPLIGAHLLRMGAPVAAECVVAAAILRQMDDDLYRQMPMPPPLRYDLGERRPERVCLHDRARQLLQDPVELLQASLVQWFRQRMTLASAPVIPGFGLLTPELAAAGAKALLGQEDVEARQAIDRMLSQRSLPKNPGPQADLAARLASWSLADQWGAPSMPGTAQEGPPPVSFSVEDLDALVALLDDMRPARPYDGDGHAWPLGDKALRAMSTVIGADPRVFAGRNPQAPWTGGERTASARALRAWWSGVRGTALEDIRATLPASAPLADIAAILEAGSARTRNAILDRLALAWSRRSPSDEDLESWAGILARSGHHAALGAVIDAWPVQGRRRSLLAAWHLQRGDRAPLERWFDEVQGAGVVCAEQTQELLALLAARPRRDDIQRLQDLLRREMDRPLWTECFCHRDSLNTLSFSMEARDPSDAVLQLIVLYAGWYGQRGLTLYQALERGAAHRQDGDDETVPTRALCRCLYAGLLTDRRPAPERLRRLALALATAKDAENGILHHPAMPDDLRVCDGVAMADWWQGITPSSMDPGNERRQMEMAALSSRLAFDCRLPLAQRDARLPQLLAHLQPLLQQDLAVLGLPPDLFPPPPPLPASSPPAF